MKITFNPSYTFAKTANNSVQTLHPKMSSTFMPSFGISALETGKLSYDMDRYQSTMVIYPEYMQFFMDNIEDIKTTGTKLILDVGSNQGELTRNIRKKYPKHKTVNLDISPELNKLAQAKDKQEGLNKNVSYETGNALMLPGKNDSYDAILYSRVLHELFSYDCKEMKAEKYSLQSVERSLREAYKKLHKRGRVLIKDPAKPEDYNKLVVITNIKKRNRVTFRTKEELLNADVRKMDTYNLLKRFCAEFEPAKGYCIFTGDSCIMPKWLASEFIRHRKFNDTRMHWKDEINEQYGVMTNKEYKQLAERIGFKVIKAEYNYKQDKNNFYAINDEFVIQDVQGNNLDQSTEFPVDQYLVLEK